MYVEVLAKVESDCSLSEARIVNMGDNFGETSNPLLTILHMMVFGQK